MDLIQFLAKKSDRGCYHRKLRPRISYITPTNKCLASPLRPHVAYILVVCTIKKAIHFYTGRFLLTDPFWKCPPAPHTGQVGATTTCSQNKHVGEFLYFKLPKLPVQVKSRSIKDVTKYVRDENAKENADLLMTLEINEKSGTQEIKCQHSYNLTLRTIGNEFMILLCGIFHPPNSFSLHRLKLTRKF